MLSGILDVSKSWFPDITAVHLKLMFSGACTIVLCRTLYVLAPKAHFKLPKKQSVIWNIFSGKGKYNKKVLLHKRKRHIILRVATTSHAVLSRGWGGTPSLAGEVPCLGLLPLPDLAGGGGVAHPWPGGVPQGTPPERTWDQWKYYGMDGYSPGCRRTHTCENIIFPHSAGNVGGKNIASIS